MALRSPSTISGPNRVGESERIRALEQRIEKDAVPERVIALGGKAICFALRRRPKRRQVEYSAEAKVGALGAQGLHRAALRQILVMGRRQHVRQAGHTRRMAADAIAEQRMDVGLVEHRPVLDAVAQPPGDDPRIVGEFAGDVAVDPTAAILQCLRQIPMVEAKPGGDAACDQSVDKPIVKIEAAVFDRAGAGRQNARPRRREPVGIKAAARQPFDVLDPAVIVVARDIAGVACLHPPGRMRINVPDALAAAVFLDRALDLIARGRCTPDEIRGKLLSSATPDPDAMRAASPKRRRQTATFFAATVSASHRRLFLSGTASAVA